MGKDITFICILYVAVYRLVRPSVAYGSHKCDTEAILNNMENKLNSQPYS